MTAAHHRRTRARAFRIWQQETRVQRQREPAHASPCGQTRRQVQQVAILCLFLPAGSLQNALALPDGEDHPGDENIHEALSLVGLPSLAGRLKEQAEWTEVLNVADLQHATQPLQLLPHGRTADTTTHIIRPAQR